MVIDDRILNVGSNPFISFEIVPPKQRNRINQMREVIEVLSKYNPPFIDVTSHALPNSYQKRRRSGTVPLCKMIQEIGADPVPHVLIKGFNHYDTEQFLNNLHQSGMHSVLALQGDPVDVIVEGLQNKYASDLVSQIRSLKYGSDFIVGVAGYPDVHKKAKSAELDLYYLKYKVDCGADYIVTNMCYSVDTFFDFLQDCRKIGINVPIVPGIKILTQKRHLESLPRAFGIKIPDERRAEVLSAKEEYVREIGERWAYEDGLKFLNSGLVPGVHFYAQGKASAVVNVVNKLYS